MEPGNHGRLIWCQPFDEGLSSRCCIAVLSITSHITLSDLVGHLQLANYEQPWDGT